MPNSAQDVVKSSFQSLLQNPNDSSLNRSGRDLFSTSESGLTEALTSATRQIDSLRIVSHAQMDVVTSNTDAILQNTAAQANGGARAIANTIGKVTTSFLGGGLGMLPVISTLTSLFNGDKGQNPVPLTTFALPSPIQFETYQQTVPSYLRLPATGQGQPAASTSPTQGTDSRFNTLRSTTPTEVQMPQVTVQVRTIDSRSFLDHSNDIARAVREAMLNMHSLNDVVTEL